MNDGSQTDLPNHDAADAANDVSHKLISKIEDGVECAKGHAQHAIDVTKDAACLASATAKNFYHTAAHKAEDSMACSKDFVRRNPVTVVLGAVFFGAAVGYLLLNARRKPTLGERFVDEPLASVRDAVFAAIGPVKQRVHDGYDSARCGMERAMGRVHRFSPGRTADTLSERICRAGSNLKFW
jgi:ElaB/YqjD/DUF883 family membrane-anchored ribosome-binding protein